MKKFVSLILTVIIFSISFTGCIKNDFTNSEKLKVVASIFPHYDFARQIGGEKVEVSMLLPPGADSHSFEPTTSDIVELSQCDIFIYTGGESDKWLDAILASADNPNLTLVSLMDCVTPIETHHGHGHENHHHSKIDEHIWTSPVNAIKISEIITAAFCEKDSKNTDYYKANLTSYTQSLNNLHDEFKKVIDGGVRKTLVFGDRFPLAYFAKEYGLEYHAAFPGCSEDTEVSASTVASLIDIVQNEKIPVVYKIELSSDSIAKTICNETDAQMMTFYSCHNISKKDFENGESYLSLMNKNVESLKIALD